ncbi:MAG TPA: sulfatase-like hydrolase/transferase [Casimicrobiaceae bacterium]|nr:sulfatase-like hydrolase/transferase [Casimicrobiaceae bacterium]
MKLLQHVSRIVALLVLIACTGVAVAANGNGNSNGNGNGNGNGRNPNILFIIMDDVGIDQMHVFGYGGADPARTPNIDAIANAGVKFRNVWAMPECSPSRAVFFEGRWPLRTNVNSAILNIDLANSQVSPFEITTPKLLKTRGYDSANFGKFHLAVDTNNPFGDAVVHALGWDYFDGFLDGSPHPIDTSAGGLLDSSNQPLTIYTCGFVPNPIKPGDGGANEGSCHFLNKTCQDMSATSANPTPGRACLEQGGIFVPNQSCSEPLSMTLRFDNQNAYYAWQRVINYPDGSVKIITPDSGDPSTRRYIGEVTTDSAVSWINGRKGNKKWMVTAAYPQIHAPYQQAPRSLLPSGSTDLSNVDCTPNIPGSDGIANYHLLSNQMLESMDAEIGRLLVQTGLASYNADGSLNYQPDKTDTMVIIIGDNGTYGPGVKPPFEISRAKGYVYQTGVWVPLIIAGPLVNSPGRVVNAMVNVADLYQLFGELGGVDVRKAVPSSHVLDSQPMLAYLTNPNQSEIRQTNFTQIGNNIHPVAPQPCIITVGPTQACVQLFSSKGICHFEGGVWYGDAPDIGTTAFDSCCELKNSDPTTFKDLTLVPDSQQAVRNDTYKLVKLAQPNCAAPPDFKPVTTTEFYQIDEAVPPALDTANKALCADQFDDLTGVLTVNCPAALTSQQLTNFNNLSATLTTILNSETQCPGDGNLDKVVDEQDLKNWALFSKITTQPVMTPPLSSSWYDFDFDGITGTTDRDLILANMGKRCVSKQ